MDIFFHCIAIDGCTEFFLYNRWIMTLYLCNRSKILFDNAREGGFWSKLAIRTAPFPTNQQALRKMLLT
jgi:hypothetical protein